jgi:PAS domain S-box-containing protein
VEVERESSAEDVTRLRDRVKELEQRVTQQAHELAVVSETLRESEHNSRLLLESIPGLVALLGADGEVQFVNRQMLEYTGKTLEELKQWGTNDTVHPEDVPHVIDLFTQAIAAGRPYDIVQRLRRSDGAYRWFQNDGFPLRDTTGRITRWCVLLTDVEDRKQAEDGLRARERFRVIIDDLPVMVTFMTPDGEFADGNRHMLDYFGAPLEELKRRPTTYSFHPDDRPSVDAQWRESVETGRPYDYEARLRRADGTYRWFHTRGFPLRDAQGRIVLWHLLQTDVDDRKRAEHALRASERNLQLIIDTMPALAWSARPDGSADFFNQHYLDFVGLSATQASGWGWTAAVHPEDLDGLAATWQRVMASGAPGEAEARLRRFDGEYRWFLFRANPLRDETGTIVRWYGVNTDIEDRKRAEAELRRAYNGFADAQRLSRTGSFITDLVGDDHKWSEEAYRIFEFDPATKVSVQRVRDVIHPDDLPAFESVIARVMTDNDVNFAFRVVTATGSVKHVRGVAHVVERVAGRPVFVGALQDVTESKMAEEALNKVSSELAHVSRVTALSALTASITHEVNQPLSAIITNASTCLRMLDADPPNVDGARATARRAIRDANRASDVIARLHTLFTKKEFTLEAVDLNEATREVVALSLSDLQRNRVVLQSQLADDLPTITGDRIQLQQVILNLLRNAVDAMVDVHDRPRYLAITTVREEGEAVRLTVRDAGVGLPPSPDSLFDAFYTTKNGGMGIGLFVSRSIVDRHRGRLWAEPNPDGPGATFSFSIPGVAESVVDAGSALSDRATDRLLESSTNTKV